MGEPTTTAAASADQRTSGNTTTNHTTASNKNNSSITDDSHNTATTNHNNNNPKHGAPPPQSRKAHLVGSLNVEGFRLRRSQSADDRLALLHGLAQLAFALRVHPKNLQLLEQLCIRSVVTSTLVPQRERGSPHTSTGFCGGNEILYDTTRPSHDISAPSRGLIRLDEKVLHARRMRSTLTLLL